MRRRQQTDHSKRKDQKETKHNNSRDPSESRLLPWKRYLLCGLDAALGIACAGQRNAVFSDVYYRLERVY